MAYIKKGCMKWISQVEKKKMEEEMKLEGREWKRGERCAWGTEQKGVGRVDYGTEKQREKREIVFDWKESSGFSKTNGGTGVVCREISIFVIVLRFF